MLTQNNMARLRMLKTSDKKERKKYTHSLSLNATHKIYEDIMPTNLIISYMDFI